jgi:hypothetical protein
MMSFGGWERPRRQRRGADAAFAQRVVGEADDVRGESARLLFRRAGTRPFSAFSA